jgi:hypothetical protein
MPSLQPAKDAVSKPVVATTPPTTPVVKPPAKPPAPTALDIFIKSPAGIKALDFVWECIGDQGLVRLADEVIAQGTCPDDLTIKLSNNKISNFGVIALARALQTEKRRPERLTVILDANEITSGGIKSIGELLSSGKCPPGLKIDFSNNSFIGTLDVQEITKALESEKCPDGVVITFGKNNVLNKHKLLPPKDEEKQQAATAEKVTEDTDTIKANRRLSHFIEALTLDPADKPQDDEPSSQNITGLRP